MLHAPELHWLFAVHALPSPSFGAQFPEEQKYPARQSASPCVLQFAAHDVPLAQTRFDGQLDVMGLPLHPSVVPLHFLMVSWFVDAHMDEQVTLLAAGVQAPAVQPPAVQVALFVGQTLC